MNQKLLDEKDRILLDALETNGRLSFTRLAQMTAISEHACERRLSALISKGVIEHIGATLSARLIGLEVAAFVRVDLLPNHDIVAAFVDSVSALPEIVESYEVTDTPTYLLKILATDLNSYGLFLRDVLLTIPGIISVESTFVTRILKKGGSVTAASAVPRREPSAFPKAILQDWKIT